MRRPGERELLDLWESGLARHPIDRALLLCAWARPDTAPERLAQLPLGAVNAGLLQLRRMAFGALVEATLACPQCGETLEVRFDLDRLLSEVDEAGESEGIGVDGYRFRLPDSRDLAAIANELDVEAAADRLLDRCCIARPSDASVPACVRDKAEALLEAADPMADLRLDVCCEACGHRWQAALDPASLLWDDVQFRAREVLGAVHALARAYGWTETEILALSPQRRASYLQMVGA